MPVGFTTVRVNVGAFIIDGLDLDDLFDDEPVTGKLVLEPMLEPGKPVQVDDNGVMKIKAIAQFPVDIGATGDISHRGRDYVTVPAPTSATTNIGQLQWKATFKDLKYGLTPITVPAIYFWAVPGAEVNLAEEVNVAPGSTAVQISRGARGYGVVGAVPVEDEPAFAIEYETPTGTALSDPIPLPEGASVPDGGIDADMLAEDAVTRAKLAQAVRDELDEKLTQTEADASYAPVQSIYAVNYLTAGASAAANTTALAQAIADGKAQGKAVCFDGVVCSINAELPITDAPQRLWSSSAVACHITQTVMGQGVFFVYADEVTIDGFTFTGPVVDNGTAVDLAGYTGDVHNPTAIKVDAGVDKLKVDHIEGDHWFAVLAGFPYPFTNDGLLPVAEYKMITNLDARNINVRSVWAAVRMSGLINAYFENVGGSYKPAIGHTRAVSAPPHVFYLSNTSDSVDVPKVWSENIRIVNCHAQDGRGGAPFSLRYIKGLTWSNLTADNCEGLVDMIGVKGFHGSGGHSTRDVYPKDNAWNGNRGSVSLLYCDDGVIDPVVVEGADAFVHGSLLYVGVCQNVTVIEPRTWFSLPAADGAQRGAYLSGRRVRVVRPTIESRGSSSAVAVNLATGFDGDSTVTLDDPTLRGAWLRGIDVEPTTTKQTIVYDPDKIDGTNQKIRVLSAVTLAGAPNLINTRYGFPPSQDTRVVGWHHGEVLGDPQSFRTRWPSGHLSTIHTDAFVGASPYIAANATVTGLMCADFGSADVDIECAVKWGAGGVGVAFRAVDTNNFLAVVLQSTAILLVKRVGGTYTTLVSTPVTPGNLGIWRDLRVRAIGTTVTAFMDGTLAFPVHTLAGGDEVTFAAATAHGLRSDNGGSGSSWHRFRLRRAS